MKCAVGHYVLSFKIQKLSLRSDAAFTSLEHYGKSEDFTAMQGKSKVWKIM